MYIRIIALALLAIVLASVATSLAESYVDTAMVGCAHVQVDGGVIRLFDDMSVYVWAYDNVVDITYTGGCEQAVSV